MGNVETEWAVLIFLNEFKGVAIYQVSGVAIFNGFLFYRATNRARSDLPSD